MQLGGCYSQNLFAVKATDWDRAHKVLPLIPRRKGRWHWYDSSVFVGIVSWLVALFVLHAWDAFLSNDWISMAIPLKQIEGQSLKYSRSYFYLFLNSWGGYRCKTFINIWCLPHPEDRISPCPRIRRTSGVLQAMVTCTQPCWAVARCGAQGHPGHVLTVCELESGHRNSWKLPISIVILQFVTLTFTRLGSFGW